MHDVLVVGGGIFGSIIARHLRELRMSVIMIDDARPERGSAPAGCVIKPSWVSSLSKSDLHAGLDLLNQYYGVHDVEFTLIPGRKKVSAYRVEPSMILGQVDHNTYHGRASMLTDHGHSVSFSLVNSSVLGGHARWAVVAAGLWTPELCPWVRTWGRWGWAFRGLPVPEPIISLWAPYKQVVAFNMSDGMSWSGDGSALVESSFRRPERLIAARSRVGRHVSKITSVMPGVRPYAAIPDKKPCLVSPHGRIIAVTGGAKNGTIAAAWAARRVEEILR